MVSYPGSPVAINNAPVPATPTNGVDLFAIDGAPYVIDSNGTVIPLVNPPRGGAVTFNALYETANHNAVSQTVIQPPTAELQMMSILLSAGQVVSTIGFCTGVTAGVAPAHWWANLLDKNRLQLAHSADQLTAALPASTWQALSLTAPFTALYSGLYYVGLMIAAATVPSVLSSQMQGQFVTGANVPSPGPGGRSSTGLTIPGVDLSTVYAAPTSVGGFYYAYVI